MVAGDPALGELRHLGKGQVEGFQARKIGKTIEGLATTLLLLLHETDNPSRQCEVQHSARVPSDETERRMDRGALGKNELRYGGHGSWVASRSTWELRVKPQATVSLALMERRPRYVEFFSLLPQRECGQEAAADLWHSARFFARAVTAGLVANPSAVPDPVAS